MSDPEAAPEVREDLPSSSPDARRRVVLQAIALIAYLYVVFAILLPRVIDYQAVIDAFLEASPAWLLVVVLVGILGWVAEGFALEVLMPSLRLRRGVIAYLSMTAVGNTMPGPVKLAIGYQTFREWDISKQEAVLGLTLNSLATQAGKLLLPAVAILLLTLTGAIAGYGFLAAVLLLLPVALGIVVFAWILRSEPFARRVGAFATRATGAVMKRVHRAAPDDLTGRLLDFRDSAKDLMIREAGPTALSQLLARGTGFVLLLVSLRAVGVPASVLPADEVLLVYAVVMVITLLPIAPGGAGLPELLYISFFGQIVGDPAWHDAIAAGVMLMRGMSWFVPIPVGYLVLILQRRAYRRTVAARASDQMDRPTTPA